MNKKELYTSPEVNVLVVRFEGVIMTLSGSIEPATEDVWGELGMAPMFDVI